MRLACLLVGLAGCAAAPLDDCVVPAAPTSLGAPQSWLAAPSGCHVALVEEGLELVSLDGRNRHALAATTHAFQFAGETLWYVDETSNPPALVARDFEGQGAPRVVDRGVQFFAVVGARVLYETGAGLFSVPLDGRAPPLRLADPGGVLASALGAGADRVLVLERKAAAPHPCVEAASRLSWIATDGSAQWLVAESAAFVAVHPQSGRVVFEIDDSVHSEYRIAFPLEGRPEHGVLGFPPPAPIAGGCFSRGAEVRFSPDGEHLVAQLGVLDGDLIGEDDVQRVFRVDALEGPVQALPCRDAGVLDGGIVCRQFEPDGVSSDLTFLAYDGARFVVDRGYRYGLTFDIDAPRTLYTRAVGDQYEVRRLDIDWPAGWQVETVARGRLRGAWPGDPDSRWLLLDDAPERLLDRATGRDIALSLPFDRVIGDGRAVLYWSHDRVLFSGPMP